MSNAEDLNLQGDISCNNLTVRGLFENSGPVSPPFPPGGPIEITIYARATGSDTLGAGTFAKPYRTFQRAIRDVPSVIPAGYVYTVDITGIGVEVLPPDYEIPAIFAPSSFQLSDEIGGSVPFPFGYGASFNIRAFPQPATNIPLADTSVPAADVIAFAQDPYSNLVTIQVAPPRASWAANAVAGKFLLVEGSGFSSCAIQGSDATHLVVALDYPVPGAALGIAECSATLQTSVSAPSGTPSGLAVLNSPQVAYQGLKLTSTTGDLSLRHSGGSQPIMSLCDVDGLSTLWVASNFWCAASVIRNYVSFDGAAFTSLQCLNLNCFVFNAGSAGNVWYSTINDGCASMGSVPTYTVAGAGYPPCGWELVDCWFTNVIDTAGKNAGAIWGNGGGAFSLENVRIDAPLGVAILSEGSAYMLLQNVGGTSLDPSVRVEDGSQVRVLDDATDIANAGGFGMQVGTLPARTWADFRGVPPIKNQFDVLSPPVGDEVTGVGSGGTSGSRLFQRPA